MGNLSNEYVKLHADAAHRRMSELFKELVPDMGMANTRKGEVVRAWNRLAYRLYNDGDTPFCGYGRETCDSSMQFLRATFPSVGFPRYTKKTGEEKLNKYAVRILAEMDEAPAYFNQENNIDSRNFNV